VQADVIVQNRFDAVAELNDWYPSTSGITWINAGGNPGGYALLGDNLGVTYALTQANGKWDRDLRDAYGGALSWDFMIYSGYPGAGFFSSPDVELSREGYASLYVGYPYQSLLPLPGVWQTYSVPLLEGTWFRKTDNQMATKAEILAVLNGGRISIRTEVISGDDAGALDNIILSGPTPPPEIQNPDINIDGTVVIRWTSQSNQFYTIYQSTNLLNGTNLQHGFSALQTNIPGTPPMNVYTDSLHGVNVKFWKVSKQ
jgi:hypothetical protein